MIGDAVGSVLAQTFEDLELIVVDDGSTDNTGETVARFRDSRVHYVYQENRERSAARNTGIRLAGGQYVAFLDSDDVWLPEKLALQVPLLDEHPNVGLVYCGAYKTLEGRIISKMRAKHEGRVVRPLLVLGNDVVGGTASVTVVRRECFDRVGYFDESCVPVEDWEMWLRVAARYDISFVPQYLVEYRQHQAGTQRQSENQVEGIRIIVEKILTNPELQADVDPVRNRVKSFGYHLMGIYCCNANNLGPARQWFVKAIRCYPYQKGSWFRLACSLFGSRFMEVVELARGRLSLLIPE